MKLFANYNQDFSRLRDRFVNTLKDDFQLNIQELIVETKDKVGGGLGFWIARVSDIVDKIRENKNHQIVYSDIDIQFFKPVKPLINQCMQSYDIVFQENPLPAEGTVNMGFMAMNCNAATERFWVGVLKEIKSDGIWEQLCVTKTLGTEVHSRNRLLNLTRSLANLVGINLYKRSGTEPLRFRLFPRAVWAFHPKSQTPPKDIILHHATWVKSEQEKLSQMESISKIVLQG